MTTLREALGDLAEVQGVRSTFLVGHDGLIVATQGDQAQDADLRAALIAATFGAIGRAVSQMDVGSPCLVRIETTTRTLHIADLTDLLLVVVAERESNSSVVNWEMWRVARLVARVTGRKVRAPGVVRPGVGPGEVASAAPISTFSGTARGCSRTFLCLRASDGPGG